MTYTFPMIATPLSTRAIRREMDRLFDDVFIPRPGTPGTEGWQPAVSAREDASGYTVQVDLPGVLPDAVEVLAEEGVLTIRGTRPVVELGATERQLIGEQPTGSFTRRFRLPKGADLQAISARHALGVLTVRVGKVAPAQPRRVPITADTAPSGATDSAPARTISEQ